MWSLETEGKHCEVIAAIEVAELRGEFVYVGAVVTQLLETAYFEVLVVQDIAHGDIQCDPVFPLDHPRFASESVHGVVVIQLHLVQ